MLDNTLLRKLASAGIVEEAFSDAQVLCLPENILHASDSEELLEPTDLVTFSKFLKSEGIKVFTFFDAGIDLAELERRSGDKWLGTIWIRDLVVLPLVIGVLANTIYGAATKTSHSNEHPTTAPVVHVELVVGSGSSQTNLKFDGDGSTLGRVLEAFEKSDKSSNLNAKNEHDTPSPSSKNRKKHQR